MGRHGFGSSPKRPRQSAVSDAVSRGERHLSDLQRDAVAVTEVALLSIYPPDKSRPDFDVWHD